MKKRNLLLTYFLLVIGCMFAYGQHRSEQEAMLIAQQFFAPRKAVNKTRLKVVPQQEMQTALSRRKAKSQKLSSNEAGYYVVNDEANHRFVIVSADERMYQVLGYSDNGTFNADNAPVQLLDVLGWYDGQMKLLEKADTKITKTPKRETVQPILPIVNSKWGQGNPFNADCPLDEKGGVSASGCVATAMAQVMNYYKYPDVAKGGSLTYKTEKTGTKQTIDFSNLAFGWGSMLNEYDADSPEQSCKEVAKLMHACGVSVFMNYNTSSGANPGVVPYAMINYFGYNSNMQYLVKDYYESKQWNSIIVNELKSRRPIIYGGQGTAKTILLGNEEEVFVGHEFILDGMDENGLYHFNFGWNGTCDGYFSVDAINPVEDIVLYGYSLGATQYDFNIDQGMVVGVCPETIGESQDVFYSQVFSVGTKVMVNAETSVKFQPYCCSNKTNNYNTFKGSFALGVFDKDWKLVETLVDINNAYINSLYGGAWKAYPRTEFFLYDSSTFQNGKQYYIALYAQHTTSNRPTLVRTLNGEQDWYRATVSDGIVYLEAKKLIEDEQPPVPPAPEALPEGLTGIFEVMAVNATGNCAPWTVQVQKDATEEGKYIFLGMDPAVSAKGVPAADNKVVGIMNHDGNIRIGNQQISGNVWFNNYSSTDSVIIYISRSDSTMKIRDTWGSVDKTTGSTVSRYTTTDFRYPASEPVADDDVVTPTIIIDRQHRVQITCATEGATIYYSFSQNGATPTTEYVAPFVLEHNGIVKAVAKKGTKTSDAFEAKENSFVVAKPKIVVDDEKNVTISCATDGALIFYTTNGNAPTSKTGTFYNGSFRVEETSTVMAVAIKEYWNDSERDTVQVIVIPEPEIVISGNKAGELSGQIEYKDKMTTTSLTVSGQLNGSDIKFIREMIIDGRLAYLDLKDASIVAGGDAYYSSSYSEYYTEDNVVGRYMFYNCKGLISIKLPSTATSICQWSFQNCSALANIELPSACVTVEDNVFYGSKNLTAIKLTASVTEFGSDNFDNCPKFEAFTVEDGNATFNVVDGVLYKNDTILVKYPMGKTDVSFSIPASVKHITKHAFSYAKMERIFVPESVITIGNYAFSNCSRLVAILLPNSIRSIGNSTFWSCKNLVNVTMPSGLEKLPSCIFYNCISLREFFIGPDIKTIDDDAFDGCTMLQSFTVDEQNAFYASEGGILYTKDMKTLWRCPLALDADELRLPESVETVNAHAFDKCVNINKFVLGSKVKRIGNYAFSNCKMLAIYMPDGITNIGSGAFWGCDNLVTFVIPDGVKTLKSNIFYGCKKLGYVYVPQNVNNFESDVFSGCKSLAYINSKIKDIENVTVHFSSYSNTYSVFENLPDTCTWRVPAGPDSDKEKYARKYSEQPWWVSTWRIVVGSQEETMTITLADNMVTFCSADDLDFTGIDGLKAYIASGYSSSTGDVIMLHVGEVPARTGLLLVGEAGKSYEIPMKGTDYVYSTLLRGVLSDTEISSGYVLKDGQFVAVSGTETVKGGEAWLDLDGIGGASRLHMIFSEPDELSSVNAIVTIDDKDQWYTLHGAAIVGTPTKPGIYLRNGRKFVIK